MARPKKDTNKVVEETTNTKEVLEQKNSAIAEDVAKANMSVVDEPTKTVAEVEIEELKKTIAQMSKILADIQNSESTNLAQPQVLTTGEELIEIGCISSIGVYLSDVEKSLQMNIQDGNNLFFTMSDVVSILKSNKVKDYFRKGILYFEDKYNYDRFRIVVANEISNDTVVAMMKSGSTSGAKVELDKMCGVSIFAKSCVMDRIAKLWTSRVLDYSNTTHEVRKFVEKYLGSKIEDYVESINVVNRFFKK